MRPWLPVLLSLTALVTAPPQAQAAQSPLDVAIVWHQHQPEYPKTPGTRIYEQPWVRLHATKDYYDMAALAAEYPGLKLTINLTPVLIQQLEDYNTGATDRHLVLTERAAAGLTPDEKREAHRRFFQLSGPMLSGFPRLKALKGKDQASYTTQDWRDLQVLSNLAWTDAMFRSQGPLKQLALKGRGYSETDKRVLVAEHRRILKAILPLHKKLQDSGRLEVITTPYFHPILPLIHDSRLASEALPTSAMPTGRMQYPQDARYHVDAAVTLYKKHFGRAPRGMWPGEGSVAQAVAPLFKAAGIQWIGTDEEILGRSLGVKLRDGETMARPDVLYRPYQIAGGPAVIFRDRKLSDDIGFRYGKLSGAAAAKDLLDQLRAIARQPRTGPRLVSLILDGENAWENYPDDGKAFLRGLYQGLSTDKTFRTVTPADYMKTHKPKPLKRLWAGSWIAGSYATWIGEDEENRAWDMLIQARGDVEAYGRAKGLKSPGYRNAMSKLYAAEGSDWFWWYGADQDSGYDEVFDAAYRGLLTQAYAAIGKKAPEALSLPIVQAGAAPQKQPRAYMRPTVDGTLARLEWKDAGAVFAEGGAMASGSEPIGALFYGWDKQKLALAVQWNGESRPLTVRVGLPAQATGTLVAGVPFRVTHTLTIDAKGQATGAPGVAAAHGQGATELLVPWTALGVRSGEGLLLSLSAGGKTFPKAPLKLTAPVLALTPAVALTDAPETGPGPGHYTLPAGGAFTRDSVDLKGLTVGEEDGQWAFTWQLGSILNPWGSPIGLSLVALDLYLAPRDARSLPGAPMPLLDARDARAERPYSHAISVEGWQQGLYAPNGEKLAEIAVAVDPLSGEVRARVPRRALPGSPEDWAFLATLSGQDGFAPGRVRKVLPEADAEHFGGRPSGRQSNMLDVLLLPGLVQASLLDRPTAELTLPYAKPPAAPTP